jgi:hypothetical protein
VWINDSFKKISHFDRKLNKNRFGIAFDSIINEAGKEILIIKFPFG